MKVKDLSAIRKEFKILQAMPREDFEKSCTERVWAGNVSDTNWLPEYKNIPCKYLFTEKFNVYMSDRVITRYIIAYYLKDRLVYGLQCSKVGQMDDRWNELILEAGSTYYCTMARDDVKP